MAIAYYYASSFAALLDKGDLNIPKDSSGNPVSLDSTSVDNILKVVFGIAGGIALIMVVIGGLKYINSLGNAQNVAKAKDTILYALIGLVVCVLAYSIVTFVIKGVS